MVKLTNFFKLHASRLLILLLFPTFTIINFSHQYWVKPDKVIAWDVKSYYAYLPAAVIHKDLSLNFIKDNPEEYNKWFWPVKTETGKYCIVTSMGVSFLYAPFFMVGHFVALSSDYEATGYTEPYAMALIFSAMFYVILGLWFLRKLLLKYFDELTTVLTIIIVLFGTNLLYYTSWSAPMTHSYSFGLISIFIYLINKWYNTLSYKRTIGIGLLFGLIVLIRPTNILVLLVLIFWNTSNLKDIGNRVLFFIREYKHVLLMMLAFFIVWVPQFLYWKSVSGKFLYYSYGGLGGKFFWAYPQIQEILLSFRKGWWIFTPVMLVSTLSIVFMFRRMKGQVIAVIIFLLANIYVQSSWWCWWFGGSFGNRAFIDSYGIMAIPLASLIYTAKKKHWSIAPVLVLLSILSFYSLFQIKQYNNGAVHYWWMSKTSYKIALFKKHTPAGYWEAIPIPDYKKAREGVYVSKNLITRINGYKEFTAEPMEIIQAIKLSLKPVKKDKRMAERHSISLDSVLTIKAFNAYEKNWSVDEYARPIVIAKMVEAYKNDTLFLEQNITHWPTLSDMELSNLIEEYATNEIKNTRL
jgi:hypothetical protein